MESKRTILVVEDEALIALAERRALESFGYAVLTVPDGEKAVETALGNPDVDLVLMDIDLGRGMDGTEAARRILERRDIPVVFLSSHTEPDIVDRTERITSYGYVVKNSGLTVLNASIRMAFRLFETRRRRPRRRRGFSSRNAPTPTSYGAYPPDSSSTVWSPRGAWPWRRPIPRPSG